MIAVSRVKTFVKGARTTSILLGAVLLMALMPTEIAPDPAPVQTVSKQVQAKPEQLPSRGEELKQRDKEPEYRDLEMEATAYCHTGNRTYTGTWPKRGTIAVDPKVISLGTRLWVEGYGYGVAEDTGGLIKGQVIDVFMESESEAIQWGRRMVKVRIME
jgi:3D (Asp-Asp-Asp) domain-containing protein